MGPAFLGKFWPLGIPAFDQFLDGGDVDTAVMQVIVKFSHIFDPETVRLIEELQNNPSVQKILQDEELMKAIAQGNLNRVGEDPKIKALMNDKTSEKIIEKNQ